jgi:hypothetical protein
MENFTNSKVKEDQTVSKQAAIFTKYKPMFESIQGKGKVVPVLN